MNERQDRTQYTGSREFEGMAGSLLEADRLRIARKTLPVLIGLTAVFGVIFLVLYFVLGRPWQWLSMFFAVVQGIVFFTLAYLQSRRGNLQLAVYYTVLGINLAALIGAVMFEGWLIQGLLLTFVSMTFARLVASRVQNRWIVALSAVTIITAIAIIGLDMFEPLPTPPWLKLVMWVAYVIGSFVLIALVMDARDGRYETTLEQSAAYAAELDVQRASLQERTQELEKRARYLQATAEVAREAAAAQADLRTLLSRVARLVSEQFGWYHTGIFLLDSTTRWAVLQAASSEGGARMLARGHRLGVGQTGTVGYVTSRGVPRISLDVGEDAVFFDNPDLPDTRSAMTLPLIVRGEIIGALDVQSKAPGAFNEEDAAVMQALADQVALAISNARLLEQVERSLEAERVALGEASRESWRYLLERGSNVGYRYEDGAVFSLSPDVLIPQTEDALPSDASVEANEQDLPELELSVSARGQTLGMLKAHKPETAGDWTQDEILLMQTLIEQLDVALDSARLYQDTRRRANREQLTRQITSNIRSAVSIEDAIKRAMLDMAQALGASDVVTRIGPQDRLAAGASSGGEDKSYE